MAAGDKSLLEKIIQWFWPINATDITTYHGEGGHKGIDIGTGGKIGLPVFAPVDGTVIKSSNDSWNNGYGRMVIIRANTGEYIIFGHFEEALAKEGDNVKAGDMVGLSGDTGNSTGPHLHFEVKTPGGGGWIDPLKYFPKITPPPGKGVPPPPPGKGTPPGRDRPYPTPPGGAGTGFAGQFGAAFGAAISQAIQEALSKIDWGNIAAGVLGIGLIAIGVFGLIGRETVSTAVSPIAGAIKAGAAKQ